MLLISNLVSARYPYIIATNLRTSFRFLLNLLEKPTKDYLEFLL